MGWGPNKEKLDRQFPQAKEVGAGPNTKKLRYQFPQARLGHNGL
ncbi:hypothetical protein [Staphylococcus marylandisciuri]|nr:hypothetical protein [Staphylococcus marylandisciuri]